MFIKTISLLSKSKRRYKTEDVGSKKAVVVLVLCIELGIGFASTKLFLRTYTFSAFTLNRKTAHLSFEKATVDLLFNAQGLSKILLNTLLIVVSK